MQGFINVVFVLALFYGGYLFYKSRKNKKSGSGGDSGRSHDGSTENEH